jgi:thiosulfate reductase cytochrome b subunit
MAAVISGDALRQIYKRHSAPVRVMHWINVLALTLLLMSGLQIFNAHAALNWGKYSYDGNPPVLEMTTRRDAAGELIGVTRIGGHELETTGVFGLGKGANGQPEARGFPWWMTIPGMRWLSMGRSWHFFFAWVLVINGLCYVAYAFVSRHFSRDLAPTKKDWRSIGQSIKDHIRFRHPTGEQAKRYNVLQKLTYLLVIFGLLPFVILMGLAMSPRLDSLFAGWVDLFGGRQSARTLHFIAAWLLVLFVLVHVFEVIITGFWNHLRSMITGNYAVSVAPRVPAPGTSLAETSTEPPARVPNEKH